MPDELSQIASLLAGDSTPPEEPETALPERTPDPESTPPESTESQETVPKALKELLAEGTSDKDLFASMIKLGDGSELSLGDFKDRSGELSKVDDLRNELVTDREKFDNERLRFNTELQALGPLLSMIDRNAAQEILDKLPQAQEQVRLTTESIITEWSKPETRESDLSKMGEFMSEWGFSKAEIKSVAASDPRTAKFLRDQWQKDVRFKDALAKVSKPQAIKGHKGKDKPKSTNAEIVSKAKKGEMGELDAISALISGK